MKYINDDGSLVIKSWCDNPEDGALDQARNLAKLPFAFRQICLMPDVHQGYGMPIGGIMAANGVVVPNAVGVDIGCGVCAVRTSWYTIDMVTLKTILSGIRERIPLGFNKHSEPQDDKWMPMGGGPRTTITPEYLNAQKSLGTLGGGNHFIEIQRDDENYIWIMVHSGSRNLGKKVADYYNKLAIDINERYFSRVPKEWELAFLPLDSDDGREYLQEMQYCVDFALANRSLMMERIKECFVDIDHNIDFHPTINIAHNYARMENHFGRNVMVHRKGATSARDNETGIIPGSQGTSSYIVSGYGNPESFMSCSHGAGRAMGRKQAERTLDLMEEQKRLDDKGILHSIRGVHDLDEASGAYKDIDVVMKEQSDLVRIVRKLEPLAVIKG